MAVKPSDLFTLGASYDCAGSSEVQWRAGINRCYYAAFLRLRIFARFLERPAPPEGRHQGNTLTHEELCAMVQAWNVKQGFPQRFSTFSTVSKNQAKTLKALLVSRKQADYRPQDDVRLVDLQLCMKRAQALLEFADSVEP